MQPNRTSPEEQPLTDMPEKAPFVVGQTTSPQPMPVVTLAPDTEMPPAGIIQPDAQPTATQADEPVRWQAYEYIHHEKNIVWFVVFGAVVVGLIAAAIFLLQSLTFAILIPIMAATLLVYNHRPPHLLDYTLSREGLHINDRLYSFTEFKGFRVIHDGEEYSVMLLPIKRFKPGVSVYFPEQAGEAIVDMLGARLPMQDFHLDLVDKIIRKLRI